MLETVGYEKGKLYDLDISEDEGAEVKSGQKKTEVF